MSALSHTSAPWNAPPPTYETQYTTTTLTPYLQLPHLLSLAWLAYPILSLLFVAFRLQLSLGAAQDAVASAKDNLLTSCKAAEQAATSTASMPRLMAVATNEQFVDAVNGTINGARFVLVTALTVMEAIINFVVDLYRSTLLCFLELVVRGGLSILIGAVQELNSVIESAANGLRTSIQNDISSANSVIQGFVNTVNKVNPFGDVTAPQISVPSLDGLANLTLPSSFQDNLTKLNASIPTVADLKDKVESIIDTPFELLKKDINDTFAQITFNSSIMPIPAQNRLAFCNDMDTSIVDDIGRDLIKTAKIGVIILILLALILTGLNCLLTWYKWRCLKNHLEYTRQAWTTDPTMYHTTTPTGVPQLTLTDHNLLMLQANSAHPLITRIVNRLSALLRLTPSQHTQMQWFFHYIFHPPATAIFLIGFFGLLCVELQLLAMGPLVHKYQGQAANTVNDFSNTIATSINNSMYNQSAAYASEVNARIDAAQSTINDGLFGWVNQTTTTLNSTISEFYSDIQNAVNTVFGGTILDQPAQEFVRCFIGSKVDAIENVLTFLHDNLQVDMPRMNDSALVLPPSTVNEAVQPIAAAAIGGGADDNEGLVGRLVNSYAESLKKERIMFGIFLGLWGLVVLMGLGVLLWHSYGREYMENRKKKKWTSQKEQGLDGMVIPFRDNGNGSVRSVSPTIRVPSPIDTKIDPENDWDAHIGENLPKRRVEQKKGFMATAKEKLVPRKAPPPFIPPEPKRQTPWFGRVATILRQKSQNTAPHEERNISKPELQSTSNDFADLHRESVDEPQAFPRESVDEPQDVFVDEPKSRWSKATTNAQTPSATSVFSPSKKSVTFSPIAADIQSPPLPPINRLSISPPRPLQPKHARNVSSSGPRRSEEAYGGLQQSLMPMPLHHGFDNGRYPPPSSILVKNSNAQRHRRSVSFSAVNHAGVGAGANNMPSAAGSLERLLIGGPHNRYARQPSMSDNPFISPFDDEHRVRIDHPAVMRKSIPTNPFEGAAM